MSQQLKYMYDVQFFEQLCPLLMEVIPGFEERRFVYRVFDTKWPDLELKQRTRQVTKALKECLPADYNQAIEIIISICHLVRQRLPGLQSYPLIFLPDYIELYGIEYFTSSMRAIEETTKLVSAEFAVRPFIERYPRETMKHMLNWSNHADEAVRRLSSEGCRPRLPWAKALLQFKKDPSAILPILENLKSDPSDFVRRSVANNLHDISKDNPEIVLNIARKWRSACPETDWIIKHGCRTLLKRGHAQILGLHGFKSGAKAQIKNLYVLNKVRIGQSLTFRFTFINKEKASAKFRLDYVIEYLTRSGNISRKVFKLTENYFKPDNEILFERQKSFKDYTTRKHYKGRHYLRILANGTELGASEFFVI
jgi:3-methyladenine DNA glycosylase AlkC